MGGDAPASAKTEAYNGTSWTEVADLSNARLASAGGGTQDNAVTYGDQPASADTELYNGTVWSEGADMNAAQEQFSGWGATGNACMSVGGRAAPDLRTTSEEWTVSLAAVTFTSS